MTFVRRVARLMLAWIFITGGFSAMRKPEGRAATAAPLLDKIRELAPASLPDDVGLVRVNGGVQAVAGVTLATDTLPDCRHSSWQLRWYPPRLADTRSGASMTLPSGCTSARNSTRTSPCSVACSSPLPHPASRAASPSHHGPHSRSTHGSRQGRDVIRPVLTDPVDEERRGA